MSSPKLQPENSSLLNRPLPHSVEAERAVLGSIIIHNSHIHYAVESLRPEDFYIWSHQWVFRSMLALYERDSPIDPLLLGEELRRTGVLEQTGGVVFLSELTFGLPHLTNNIKVYAKVIKSHSLARMMIKTFNRGMCDVLEERDDPKALLRRIQDRLTSFEECARDDGGTRPSLMLSYSDFMNATFDDGEEIAFHARRGELALVQSVTNHGKSTLIRNAALALAAGFEFRPVVEAGKPLRVLLLNLEGSAGWFQSDLRVMTHDLPSNVIELIRANFLPAHAPMVNGEPLSLSRHMKVLENDVRRAGGVDVLILDTATAAFSLRNENDNAEVANRVMKPLVKLARRLNALIVLLHHVGKAKAEEGATREQAHRGRGASAWGDFSTSIFNLDADPNDRDRVTITCGKRKNGSNYERLLLLDRERRWFRVTEEKPAKRITNDDIVLSAIMGSGKPEISTADVEKLLARKMCRSTIMNCLARLADLGKVEKPRRGWWALAKVCLTCLTPLRESDQCTNCDRSEKSIPAFSLAAEAGASPNGNGFSN